MAKAKTCTGFTKLFTYLCPPSSPEFFEAQEVTQDMGTVPEKAELFFPWHLGHVRGSTLPGFSTDLL
jgi:hypothetical protein